MYDFDKLISRRGTNSLKHDGAALRGMPEDAIPMWVADMDFMAPPESVLAAVQAAAHGVYGYTLPPRGYHDSIIRWHRARYGWQIEKDWIVDSPGVMATVSSAIRAFTETGDAILIQEPVYYCFAQAIYLNGRRVVSSDLVYGDGQYQIDFNDFEDKIVSNNVKMFLLCHPHNPTGRVFDADELRRMGEICMLHGVLVFSDEIHEDFVYAPRVHVPYATLGENFADSCVVCNAPSKTFNLAGLHTAAAVVPNTKLRAKLERSFGAAFCGGVNAVGGAATEAAYTYGGSWLEELKSYLLSNYAILKDGLAEKLPLARVQDLQATYLAWLDFRALGLPHDQVRDTVWRRAKLWLNDGRSFGESGAGFMRINLACPASVVREAVDRLAEALG